MYKKSSIKTPVILITVIFTVLSLLIPNIYAYPIMDNDDGIWTDDFRYTTQNQLDQYYLYQNCTVDIDNGRVLLIQTPGGLIHDFNGEGHIASSYRTKNFGSSFLYSPGFHQLSESYFDFDGKNNIKRLMESSDPDYRYASSSSRDKYVVHHFKFKLTTDTDKIEMLKFSWFGKGEDTSILKLYYWKATFESFRKDLFGSWVEIDDSTSNDDIELNKEIFGNFENIVNDNNEIHICVVAEKASSADYCILRTDYVNVSVEGPDGYKTDPAYIYLKNPIEPESEKFYWERFTWNDYERGGATIKYQIFYESSEGYKLVGDEYIEGNSDGLTNPPVNIYNIPTSYKKLRIKAILESSDPLYSPKLFSWSLTWQNDINRWQDNFNSSIRIDVKNRIKIDENVTISPVSGEWPLFGQNTQNTRSSDGKGADFLTDKYSYWWSKYHEENNERLTDPVISDEYLYICANSEEGNNLYRYQIIVEDDDIGLKYTDDVKTYFDGGTEIPPLLSSPALTDEFIVVASGDVIEEGNDDSPTNYIYTLKKDGSGDLKSYEYDGYISYWASPIALDNMVYITSWSGDYRVLSQTNDNNKVLALEMKSDGELTLKWEYDLPAPSFSTPALYNGMLFVGCKENTKESFFVFDTDSGTLLWNTSVGAIGKASPVVYNETVFVTSQQKRDLRLNRYQTVITAFDIYNGTLKWEKAISKIMFPPVIKNRISPTMADSSPSVYNGVIYAISADGKLLALSVSNGDEIWSKQISSLGIFNLGNLDGDINTPLLADNFFSTSPSYADGTIYVSASNGNLYFINANNGETIGTKQSKPYDFTVPFITSPIVSNGLVFVAAGKGNDPANVGNYRFYCFGLYEQPEEEIDGYLISIPITCPKSKYWNEFHADFEASDDGNNIEFTILDEDKNYIRSIENGDKLSLGDKTLDWTIRLRANLSADNVSLNPELAYWYVSFASDALKPEFVVDSIKPNPEGSINTPTPTFKIDVWDNESGLRLSSAKYILEYYENSSNKKTYTDVPQYSGVNGTDFTTLIANISLLDFADSITKLGNISFYIKDIAHNEASYRLKLKQDNEKPTSNIDKEINGSSFTTNTVFVEASAKDSISDIKSVELFYRYSGSKDPSFSGDWISFDIDETFPYTWNFEPSMGGGNYELMTIATDSADNVEDIPDSGDVYIIFDNELPDVVDDLSVEHWFKQKPEISVEFSDDFLLDSIKYRISEFGSEWILIKSSIFKSTYSSGWDLNSDYWDSMENGELYTIDFWISDYLGNIQIIEKNGYKIGKDTTPPHPDLEIGDLGSDWDPEDPILITASISDDDDVGVKSVELFYRYSKDGNFKGDWISYGVCTKEPFEWEFYADDGNGYYEFKTIVEDLAGNVAESNVKPLVINADLPIALVGAMIALICILIIIVMFMFTKWKKK